MLSILCWLAGLSAVACAIAGCVRPDEGEAAIDNKPPPRWSIHLIWLAVFLKLGLVLQAVQAGYVTQWPDDGVRYLMSLGYVDRFAWGPGDHVWPGGPFILNGFVMKLTGGGMNALRWLMVVYTAGSVLATAWTIREATGSAFGAIAGAFLISALPMHTWLSTGAMTEVPFSLFLVLALACVMAGWRSLPTSRVRGWILVLLGAFSATLASSFRYEGWMFIASTGAICGAHLVIRLVYRYTRKSNPESEDTQAITWKEELLLLVVAGVVCMFYPVAWMIDSWRGQGHPMAFFQNQVSMNTVGVEEPLVDKLLLYPRAMHQQIGHIWGIAIGGVLSALILCRRFRLLRFLVAGCVGYFLILVIVSADKGVGVSMERYVISVLAVTFLAAGAGYASLGVLWNRSAGPWRILPAITAVLLAGSLAGYAGRSISTIERYKHWGYTNESFVAGFLLQQEFHEPKLLPGLARGGRVVVWEASGIGDSHHLQIPMMAGKRGRVDIYSGTTLRDKYRDEPNLTILQFNGDSSSIPGDFTEVAEIGTLKVYHRFSEEKPPE